VSLATRCARALGEAPGDQTQIVTGSISEVGIYRRPGAGQSEV